MLGEQIGESQDQIRRYIRLTELIPAILDMVDEGKIAFRPAVELSYLTKEEQENLLETMECEDCTPSLVQTIKMKHFSKDNKLNEDVISSILQEEKPNQVEQFKIPKNKLTKYFPTGTYEYDLLGNDSPVRKALYYLPGGYGYEKHIKNQYLGGWAEDDAYVIGHLVVSYIYAGYSAGSGAFYGAPQSYIDKALEVNAAIGSLPNPPESFRAFLVPGSGRQTITGSWYQKPYGWMQKQEKPMHRGQHPLQEQNLL